jgi:exonuclease SbcC
MPSKSSGSSAGDQLVKKIYDQNMILKILAQDKANANAKLTTLASDLRREQEVIDDYQRALAKDRTCPECGQKVSITHLKQKLDDAKDKADDIIKEQRELTRKRDAIGKKLNDVESEVQNLNSSLRVVIDAENEIGRLQHSKQMLVSQTNPHKASLDHLRVRRLTSQSAIEQAEKSLDDAEKQSKACEFWADAFKEIRLSIIDDTLRELAMAATRHAEALGLLDWRIEFATERETKQGNISLAFTVLLYPAGEDQAVKFESYSGGESQRLQLAIAFGLSEVLLERAGVDPNIEIYDEPTRGLSSEGVEQLLEHLRVRAIELDRSIFVTEHHSLERGLFDDTIMIEKTDKGARIIAA